MRMMAIGGSRHNLELSWGTFSTALVSCIVLTHIYLNRGKQSGDPVASATETS